MNYDLSILNTFNQLFPHIERERNLSTCLCRAGTKTSQAQPDSEYCTFMHKSSKIPIRFWTRDSAPEDLSRPIPKLMNRTRPHVLSNAQIRIARQCLKIGAQRPWDRVSIGRPGQHRPRPPTSKKHGTRSPLTKVHRRSPLRCTPRVLR